MAFVIFLSKSQRMFNIFEQQGEEMTEDSKVRFLLHKTQNTGLTSTVSAIKACLSTDPLGTITFAIESNHIASCISKLPVYIAKNRTISIVKLAPNTGITKATPARHIAT